MAQLLIAPSSRLLIRGTRTVAFATASARRGRPVTARSMATSSSQQVWSTPLLLPLLLLASSPLLGSAAVTPPGVCQQAVNVLGGPLECCCTSPMTGFYR